MHKMDNTAYFATAVSCARKKVYENGHKSGAYPKFGVPLGVPLR
jgi:hypothetical protein